MIRLKKNNGRVMTRLERAEYKKLKSSQKSSPSNQKESSHFAEMDGFARSQR